VSTRSHSGLETDRRVIEMRVSVSDVPVWHMFTQAHTGSSHSCD